MIAANLLAKKRDGEELSEEEIRFLIEGFCDGSVADYQMSAFAMAVCMRGMTERETVTLTRAMLSSGDTLSREVSGDVPRVDKHSTGGLGDKVSLILAPLLAACDLHVPMVSGRGLGITGGTLDKLEAIPGMRTAFTAEEADQLLARCGTFIMSASERIAPADRRLYALRDVTGTVESIPLITASILSKKLSANLDALVMDVKVGSGAFMKTLPEAHALAESLRRVGSAAGLQTEALISDMDQPLGRAVGNAIEVNESLAVLRGESSEDPLIDPVRRLTVELAARLLVAVDVASDLQTASKQLETALDSGAAMERFERMVVEQGGRLGTALTLADSVTVNADRSGYVEAIDCRQLGSIIIAMGGGRRKVGDTIDPAVGISMNVRIGDRVQSGQSIMELHCHKPRQTDYVGLLKDAVKLSEQTVPPRPLVL